MDSKIKHQIQRICVDRGITTLCHFTRIENLSSILQKGLLSRSILETSEQQFFWNDPHRADGHPEAICLSISFPNYLMFYSIRRDKEDKQGINHWQWVVLLLDAKMLWELDCAFCQENASSNAVRFILLKDRKKPDALNGMFVEDYHTINRQSLQIPSDYPTNPQAEVLVFDTIPARYINEVHFLTATALDQWFSSNQAASSQTFSDGRRYLCRRDYFSYRCDYQRWQSANLDNNDISEIDEHQECLENSEPSIDDDIPF